MDRVNWTLGEQYTAADANRLHEFPQAYFKELLKAFSGSAENWIGGLGSGFELFNPVIFGPDLAIDVPAQYFAAGGLVALQPLETIFLIGNATKRYWIYFVIWEQDVDETRPIVDTGTGVTSNTTLLTRKIEGRAVEIVVLADGASEAAPLIGSGITGDASKIIIGVVRLLSILFTTTVLPTLPGAFSNTGPIPTTPGAATVANHAASHVDETGSPTADRIAFPTTSARGTMPAKSLTYLTSAVQEVLGSGTILTIGTTGTNIGAPDPGNESPFLTYGTANITKTITFNFDPDFFVDDGGGLAPNLDPGAGWDTAFGTPDDGSVSIEQAGTPVANTPHTTLNFIGGATAVDAGGGQVDIDASGGSSSGLFSIRLSLLEVTLQGFGPGNTSTTFVGSGALIPAGSQPVSIKILSTNMDMNTTFERFTLNAIGTVSNIGTLINSLNEVELSSELVSGNPRSFYVTIPAGTATPGTPGGTNFTSGEDIIVRINKLGTLNSGSLELVLVFATNTTADFTL